MFGVIFDMDGTLLDTQKIAIPAWDYAGERQGFKNAGIHVPKACGVNLETCKEIIRKTFKNVDVEAFRNDATQYIDENLVVAYKEGIKELLDFLKENRIPMAIASGSNREKVLSLIDEVGATDYFSAIIGGDEIENSKPHPEIFLRAAKLLNLKPEECFVFEDSGNGIIASHRANIKCFGIPDVVTFDSEIKQMLFAELETADKAIDILKKYL